MPSLPKRRAAVCSAALIAWSGLPPVPAHGAGFAIFEQGAMGMGFAGAFTAQASDPSAIFHNAAGIAFLKGSQLYLGATLIHPSTDFTGADPFPGAGSTASQSVGIIPVPAAYFTHQFSERTVFGLGVHAPFGLKTEWDDPDGFSGRFLTQLAQLKGFSVNPTVGFKLEDRLSVGAGLDIRFASVTLERSVPLIDPFSQRVVDVGQAHLESDTATDFGFNIGLLARPNDSLSLGLSYRHKVHMDLSGSASFSQTPTGNPELDSLVAARLPAGDVALATAVEFPAIFSAGAAYAWNDWRAEFDVNWYQWSAFDRLVLEFESRPDLNQVIEEQYENVFQYRVGIERRLNDTWQVRGGYFFDKSPAPPESISPLLPDASRHGLALGGTWRSGGALRVDGALWGIFAGDRSTEGRNRDRFDGSYSSSAVTFGLFLGYSF